jgi:hypothetical protein
LDARTGNSWGAPGMALMVQDDVQNDRHCDRLLDFEREPFFAEYLDGNGQEIA